MQNFRSFRRTCSELTSVELDRMAELFLNYSLLIPWKEVDFTIDSARETIGRIVAGPGVELFVVVDIHRSDRIVGFAVVDKGDDYFSHAINSLDYIREYFVTLVVYDYHAETKKNLLPMLFRSIKEFLQIKCIHSVKLLPDNWFIRLRSSELFSNLVKIVFEIKRKEGDEVIFDRLDFWSWVFEE